MKFHYTCLWFSFWKWKLYNFKYLPNRFCVPNSKNKELFLPIQEDSVNFSSSHSIDSISNPLLKRTILSTNLSIFNETSRERTNFANISLNCSVYVCLLHQKHKPRRLSTRYYHIQKPNSNLPAYLFARDQWLRVFIPEILILTVFPSSSYKCFGKKSWVVLNVCVRVFFYSHHSGACHL